MKGFLNEFKEFALKGNVIDLAVGIIIGAAFTAIITSLVNDIISPLLGLFVSVNFSSLQAEAGGAVFTYGNFIMAVINFLLVALVLFMIIRSINRRKNETKNLVDWRINYPCFADGGDRLVLQLQYQG